MYICNECELVFNSPKKYSEDCTPYGGPAEPGFSNSYYGCPYCEGSYEEAMQCVRCNDNYIPAESSEEPFCMDCINDILSEYAEVIKNNFREDEYDAILNHIDDVVPFKEEK
jgi:hypothetical protein